MKNLALKDRFGGTVERFRGEMEDLVQRMFGDAAPTNGAPVWAPHVDLTEAETEYVAHVDLPGVEAKNIDVSVADGMLVIKGERKDEKKEEKKGYQRLERFTGSFYREITIPTSVDGDKITAETCNGVVCVHLPKKPELKPKKVPVTEGAS